MTDDDVGIPEPSFEVLTQPVWDWYTYAAAFASPSTATFTVNELLTGDMPIGQPVAHTIVYVLDRSLAPVAVGVPGA